MVEESSPIYRLCLRDYIYIWFILSFRIFPKTNSVDANDLLAASTASIPTLWSISFPPEQGAAICLRVFLNLVPVCAVTTSKPSTNSNVSPPWAGTEISLHQMLLYKQQFHDTLSIL